MCFCPNGNHINMIVKSESKQECWKTIIDLDMMRMSKAMQSLEPQEEEHYHQSITYILVEKLGNNIVRVL